MTIGKRIRPDGRERRATTGEGRDEGTKGGWEEVVRSLLYNLCNNRCSLLSVEFLPQFHEMLMGCGIRSRSRSLAHSIRARTVDPSLALELELESWHSMTTAAKRAELSLPDCGAGGFATHRQLAL